MKGFKQALSVIFIMATAILTAQTKEELLVKAEVWQNAPKEFKETAIPSRWAEESAVIIATGFKYDSYFIKKRFTEFIVFHHRVKLLDKAAVDEFSEISFDEHFLDKKQFRKADSYLVFGIKVIKPNGTEKEADLKDAVKDNSESNDLKIAVPDLEPGDIIDYFAAGKKMYPLAVDRHIASTTLLAGRYPVMTRMMNFNLHPMYQLESIPFNGSPNFSKTEDENNRKFIFIDTMRNKEESFPFAFGHLYAPEIRYRVKRNEDKRNFKKTATDYLDAYTYNMSSSTMLSQILSELNVEKDPRNLSYQAYYLLRHPVMMNYYLGTSAEEPMNEEVDSDYYFKLLSKLLGVKSIGHNIMLISNREYGSLQDQVSLEYADVVLRVNADKPIYLSRIGPLEIPGLVPPEFEFESVPSLMSSVYPSDGNRGSNETTIPPRAADQNVTTTELNVNINANEPSFIDVTRDVSVLGHNKKWHQMLVVTNYDYLREYNRPLYKESATFLKMCKDFYAHIEKLEQQKAQDYNARDRKVKQDIEEAFSSKVNQYKNFQLKSIGMWDETPYTEYRDEFTLENMTKKAGPNYILELPKLIEKQTEITAKQRTRTQDIYMSYARTYVNKISFKIPEGYTIEGIENLNKDVQNETGGFVSTAKVEGDMLRITSKKYYSANYFPAKDWEKMMLFLDAAVEFSNAKVLLKKK
jgi:hypothetical protein